MKPRSLADWASIAEILSSIAVLVTLVFLVWEIRQNTDAVRAGTYQDLNAVVQGFNAMFVANPEVGEFIAQSSRLDHDMSPGEEARLRAFISSMYRHADNIYFQYKLETLSEQQMLSLLLPIVINIQRRPRLLYEWQNGVDRSILDPELVALMDQEINLRLEKK